MVEGEDSPHPKYQLAFVLSHGVQSEITVKHINDTPTLSFGVFFFKHDLSKYSGKIICFVSY